MLGAAPSTSCSFHIVFPWFADHYRSHCRSLLRAVPCLISPLSFLICFPLMEADPSRTDLISSHVCLGYVVGERYKFPGAPAVGRVPKSNRPYVLILPKENLESIRYLHSTPTSPVLPNRLRADPPFFALER